MTENDKSGHIVIFDQALHSMTIIVAVVLFVISISLIVLGLKELIIGWMNLGGQGLLEETPSSIIITSLGMIVIGIAVLDLTKSILDEQLAERKRKNVQERSRDFLTRFLPVIIFALSAEVFVKLAQTDLSFQSSIFADVAMLGIAVGAMLVGLALYLKMTAPENKAVLSKLRD